MQRRLAILFILLSPLGAEAADDFVLATQGPSLEGKWAFRSFTISSEGSDNWADAAETVDSVEFSEAGDGSLTGTMVLHGKTFPISGHVSYGNDRVLVTWSGEHPNEDLTIRRVFQAYLLPMFAHADEQVDVLAGTEGVTVVGDGFGASSSFVAVPMEF